jgi:hypothetical protein
MRKEKSKSTYEKTLVIPIEKKMWQNLRKISFDKEISMSELTRMGIEKILNKYSKVLTLDRKSL